MPRDDPGSPSRDTAGDPGAGAGSGAHDRGREDDPIERRLRTLGSVCAVLAAAVLVTAGTLGWAAGRAGAGALMASPPAGSFLIALGAMLLVLLASAVHRRILRPAAPAELDADPEGDPAGEPEAPVAARLRAYSWATGVSFGMLAAAAALGAVVAQSGKALFYGLVICLAALIAMMARWPRRSSFDLADRGERSGP